MTRRHPHVFGDVIAEDERTGHANWEALKAEEWAKKHSDKSILADIPAAFPALVRAQKLQKRAARVGFDWPNTEDVYAKIDEEYAEVKAAETASDRAEEIGDLLFAVVNLARHYRVDAEEALRATNRKFERRFRHIEQNIGKPIQEAELQEMEALWQAAKIA
jgi:MazG family protein